MFVPVTAQLQLLSLQVEAYQSAQSALVDCSPSVYTWGSM